MRGSLLNVAEAAAPIRETSGHDSTATSQIGRSEPVRRGERGEAEELARITGKSTMEEDDG